MPRPANAARTAILLLVIALCVSAGPARGAAGQDLGKWKQLGAMPITNAEAGATALDGKVYLVGGFNDLSGLWIYDARKGSWTRGRDIPAETHHPGVEAVGDLVYVIGGHSIDSKLHIYDPATDTWSQGADLPRPQRAQATVVLDGRIHSIGGTTSLDGGGGESYHQVYDPATDTWETLAPLLFPREHGYAAVLDGKIYFVAGRFGTFIHQVDLQIYDPVRDRWTLGASVLEGTSGHAVQAVGGRIYAIGGEQVRTETVLQLNQVYDPTADAWSLGAPPPTKIHAAPNVVIDGSIYLFGGLDVVEGASKGRDWVYRFDPPVPPAPSRLRARSVGADGVRLKWKFKHRKSDATEIEVQRRGDEGDWQTEDTTAPKVRKLVVRGLAAGSHEFRVRANGPSGPSAWSGTVVVEIGA